MIAPVPPAAQIGRYRLVRRLGAGAFGVVWLAHDDSLDAPVALKVMAENWAQRLDLRERFLAEARLLRRASSSRVVQIFDIGELPDGRPYFVMEYADRGTLADRLDAGLPPLPKALRLAAEVARGAAALHESGAVHRDLKPSNILLASAPDGGERVLIADLGLAKSLAQASGFTAAVGSAGFMAPEQAVPGTGIDERADVYSLGALSYLMLTGAVPGPAGRVVRPDRARPDLPPGVQRAVLRALEPDRERRWPSALSYAQELDGLARQAEVSSGGKRSRRRRRRVPYAVLAAVVLAAGGGVAALELGVWKSSGQVKVSDATGQISVQVPGQWGVQLLNAGWNQDSVGLPSLHDPGLLIATDAGTWQQAASNTQGVFVGTSQNSELPARVLTITHPGCSAHTSAAYTSASWRGQVVRWSSCGGGRTYDEVGLTPVGGRGSSVYVEVRQDGGADLTDQILGSLQVSG